MIGAGLCKGIYDANIFASLFDVIRPEDRGTAAGLMNTVGWSGGVRGADRGRHRVGDVSAWVSTIASTAAVYLLGGLLALLAARLAETRPVRRELNLLLRHRETSDREFLGGQQTKRRRRATPGPDAATSTPSSG